MTTAVFTHAEAVRRFTLEQNRRVEDWLARNRERVGLATTPSAGTISNALAGKQVSAELVSALNLMVQEMRADPWAWCEPPNEVEAFSDYAPLRWWHRILDLKDDIPMSVFARVGTLKLSDERYRILAKRFDSWFFRLRAACDQYKADRALVQALAADEDPEFQAFCLVDGEWRLGAAHAGTVERRELHRVGNPGLHGRSLEEVGMALALQSVSMSLPDIERACLTYARPEPERIDEWHSDPVEPWNGIEFDGVEYHQGGMEFENVAKPPSDPTLWRVRFWWDGERYQVEDVEPFARVKQDGQWRDTTQQEREFWITGMEPMETRADLLDRKDAWIDEVLQSRNASPTWQDRMNYPDGVPREVIEKQFEVVLSRICESEAAQHNAESERRLRRFRRGLRSRNTPSGEDRA